jgi:hypothetical protein
VQHADERRRGSGHFSEAGIGYYAGENNPTQAAQPRALFRGSKPDCQADHKDCYGGGYDAMGAYGSSFLAGDDGAGYF